MCGSDGAGNASFDFSSRGLSSAQMRNGKNFTLVLVTAPDLKTARRLARSALQARLIACVNLAPKVESHYWWQGKIESAPEVLMVLKTKRSCLAALERWILSNHPYDTPEILAVPISAGSERYLAWLAGSVRS